MDWNSLKAVVKDFLIISRGFCFDVNNPNSILIFNSLKKKRNCTFCTLYRNTTWNGSCLYWIFKNEKTLTMLTSVLHCLYRDFCVRFETADAEHGVFH